MDYISIGRDDLICDDSVIWWVEVEKFLALCLSGLDSEVDLAGGCRLAHLIIYFLPINISDQVYLTTVSSL